MKRRGTAVIFLAVLFTCSICRANITGLTYASDGDAFVCSNYTWTGSSSILPMNVYGDQFGATGSLFTDVTTDSELDPTLTIGSVVDNDTSFAWTSYLVNVYMNTTFTLSGVAVSTPGDWTVVNVLQPVFTGSNYVGRIQLDTGAPIAIGGQLGFGYSMIFSSATHYSFTQEMTAIPEPGTLEFVTVGGLLLAAFPLSRIRRRK